MINKYVFLLLLIMTFIIVQPRQAAACSCAVPDNATDAMEQASAVIQGKVISIREETIKKEKYDVALIEVEKSWKGSADSHVKIYTSWSSCHFDFVENEEYLLYPYEHEGMLQVINCGRSAEISEAGLDLRELGEGFLPMNMLKADKHFVLSQSVYIAMAAIVISLFLIIRPRKNN